MTGILLLIANYQGNHPEKKEGHITGNASDVYLEWCRCVNLIREYNKISDKAELDNELKTLDRYIFERQMDTAHSDVKNDDLTIQNFDEAAVAVVKRAHQLREKINLNPDASTEEISEALKNKKSFLVGLN